MQSVKLDRHKEHQKYFLSDGTQVPGGSTISKIGDDAGALIHWAWKLGCEGKNYRDVSKEACDIGTLAHFYIECFLNNQVADLSDYTQEERDKALVCYQKFIQWWETQDLEVVATEIQLVNELYQYGGTIDLIAKRKNGSHVLMDFKTSKKISESYWRQAAGYAQLWNCNYSPAPPPKSDWLKCGLPAPHVVRPVGIEAVVMNPKITDHAIVRIGKEEEGDFEVVWKSDLSNEWYVFQKQVNLYWAMKAAKPEPKPRGRKKK
jgi:hypothetical protein